MIVWPATLPQCLVVGYSGGLGDGLIESQPDTGPSMSRRRTAAVMKPLNGWMKMTKAQKIALTEFYEETLLGGALTFSFPDPDDNTDTVTVKFPKSGQPKWSQINGDTFRVEMTLMIMP